MSKKKSPKKKSKRTESPPLENPADLKSKQARLPSMEDTRIDDLEAAAEQYAEVRDERIAVGKREVDLKGLLLQLMHRHDKKEYRRNGISISVVMEEETVKVRVTKEE